MDYALMAESFAGWMLRTHVQASVVVLLVLAAQVLFRRWLSPGWRYALWGLVLLRLIVPVLPQSPLSIFNLGRLWAGVEEPAVVVQTPPTVTVTVGPADATFTAPRATAPAGRAGRLNWKLVLLLTWIAGAACVALWTAAGTLRLHRRLRRTDSAGAHAAEILNECRALLRVRRRVGLALTVWVSGPAVCGVFRPTILIPPRLLHELTPEQLRLVFLHELAHVKGWDLAVDWICRLALAVHWFNPLLWLAWSRACAERELARDEAAIHIAGDNGAEKYGQTILQLLESAMKSRPPVGVVGIWEERRRVKERIAMLATRRRAGLGQWIMGTSLSAILLLTTLTNARAADDDPMDAESGLESQLRQPEAENAAEKLLNSPIADLDLNRVALHKVARLLQDSASSQIYVDWRALKSAGLDRNFPITLRLEDATLGQALDAIVQQIARRSIPFSYAVDSGAVVISTPDSLRVELPTRVYDLGDLLPTDGAAEERAAEMSYLVELIRELAAEPNTWRDNGGKWGNAYELSEQLIITHTSEVHQRIVSLLENLREKNRDNSSRRTVRNAGEDAGGGRAATDLLDRRVSEARFDAVAFADMLDFVREYTGAGTSVQVNWRGLEAIGVGPNTPITVKLRDVTLRKALEEILDEAGGGKLGYVADGGLILITGADDLGGLVTTVCHRFVRLQREQFERLEDFPTKVLLDERTKEGILLSHEQLDELLKVVRHVEAEIVTAPNITTFSGQSARVSLGTSSSYIAGYTEKLQAGKREYEPKTDAVQVGLRISSTATVAPDGSEVQVVTKLTLRDLIELRVKPWEGAPEGKELMVQVPETREIALERQATLEAGQAFLIGPLRFQPQRKDEPDERLYVLIGLERVGPVRLVAP